MVLTLPDSLNSDSVLSKMQFQELEKGHMHTGIQSHRSALTLNSYMTAEMVISEIAKSI